MNVATRLKSRRQKTFIQSITGYLPSSRGNIEHWSMARCDGVAQNSFGLPASV
jgi:hypothetical protein